MIAYKSLSIIVMGLVLGGWCVCALADEDVTIISAPDSQAVAPVNKTPNSNSAPVVHKSLHKNKATDSATTAATTPISVTPGTGTTPVSSVAVAPQSASPPGVNTSTLPISLPSAKATTTIPHAAHSDPPSSGLTVETGLPVARRDGLPGLTSSSITPSGLQGAPVPSGKLVAGTYPAGSAAAQISSTVIGTYSSSGKSMGDMAFPDTNKKPTNRYPWKTNIITTEFWIGEPGSDLSATTNHDSAWIQDWGQANGGKDNPYDRIGYGPADHAPRVNPFYVALPFNDLAYPDKARQWLPAGWHRPMKDGKQVSACKDRWVEIKNAKGNICYAQWEDVGPLVSDHAEYVFGDERPYTLTRAGLDVSPAVAQYLGMDENNRTLTSWRFVDAEDVPPGVWLVYDERAVFYNALHQKGTTGSTFQGGSEPSDDSSSARSNKKKVGAAKG